MSDGENVYWNDGDLEEAHGLIMQNVSIMTSEPLEKAEVDGQIAILKIVIDETGVSLMASGYCDVAEDEDEGHIYGNKDSVFGSYEMMINEDLYNLLLWDSRLGECHAVIFDDTDDDDVEPVEINAIDELVERINLLKTTREKNE